MKYSINLDHELRIVRYKQSGLISADDIANAWDEFLSMQEFTQLKYNLLSDYRNGEIQIPIDYLSEIIEFMRKIKHIVKGKKQAFIVDNAYNAVASMLFKENVYKEVGFKIKIFSTEADALKWLTK